MPQQVLGQSCITTYALGQCCMPAGAYAVCPNRSSLLFVFMSRRHDATHHFSLFIVVSFCLCRRHRSKWSQVVKDQDSALRNVTTTDTVLPEGEKAVHSNCMAHTHMHVHKIGAVTGTLSNKEALP
jgi:hypothetical protein